MGFDALMRSAQVKHAFPMHMWEKYDTVEKLRNMRKFNVSQGLCMGLLLSTVEN